tara:strand:+ start:3741 stop:4277 length:537 start_codon:yes stop_codon:yes gene_type:complete
MCCKEVKPADLFAKGMQLVRDGKTREAISTFVEFTRKHTKSGLADNAYYNLGICHKELQDFVKAAVFFKIVLIQYPNSDAAPWARDQLEDLENLMDPASEIFIKAEQALIEDSLEDAWTGFSKIMQDYPQSVLADNALFSLGMIARKKGDYKRAQQLFDQIVRDFPNSDAASNVDHII